MAPCHKIDNVGCLAKMEVVVFLKALLHRWHVQNLVTQYEKVSTNIIILIIDITPLQYAGVCLQHVFNTQYSIIKIA